MTDSHNEGGEVIRERIAAEHRPEPPQQAADSKPDNAKDVWRAQDRVLALSRTAAEVQALLDPDRVLQTICDELRDQGLYCFFGLLDDDQAHVVLRNTNLSLDTLRATEAILGSIPEFSFPADASAAIAAVVRDGKIAFDQRLADRLREILPHLSADAIRELLQLLQARRAISAPLVAGANILGLLTVWSEDLTEEEIPIVSVMAQQAAVTLERASLYEDTMLRVFEMEALRKTTLDITRQLDLSQLLRLIVERAAALSGTEAGALYLYRPDQNELELVVSHNLGQDYTGLRLQAGEGLSGRVLLTGEPLAVEDYSNWEHRSHKYDDASLRSVQAVPMKWGGKTIGVLNLTNRHSTKVFNDRDLWLLEWFANHAAVAIENARLFADKEHTIRQLAALYDVSLEVLAETDPSQLLLTIVQKACELLDAEAGAIDLFDHESQLLEMKYSHGYNRDYSGIKLSAGQGVAGMVCKTQQPLAIDDYANWAGRVPQVDKAEISAALGVPLLSGDKLLGALTIDRRTPRSFNDEDIQSATLFANQAAIAIENARLYHEQERRSQELLALYKTSLQVASRLDLHSLLRTIITQAITLVGGRSGDIYLYRPDSDDLLSAASENMPDDLVGAVIKRGEGLAGKVLETGQPLIVDDYESWPGRSDRYCGHGFARVMGVPILYGDDLLGILVAERDKQKPPFANTDQNLLELFAHQAAVAIENSRLFEETRQRADELEALYQVSTEIATQLELPSLLETIVRRAMDLLRANAGGLYLYDPQSQDLELIADQGHTRPHIGSRLAPGEGACGRVAESGESLVVRDYGNWEGRSPHFEDEPTCNTLAVPIWRGETLLGAIFVDDNNLDRAFGERDLRLANLFANQAAIAIQNAHLFGEREHTIRQLAALQDVSLEVVAKTDLTEVLPTIVRVAAQLLDAQAGAIDLLDPQSQELVLNAVYGYDEALIGMRHAPEEGVVGCVAQTKKPVIVKDYSSWEARSPQWADQSVGSVIGVPLMRGDQLLGALTIDRPVSQPFDDRDVNLATLFANQAAIAIQNARTVAATERRVTELTALREISLQLTQSLDLETVLNTIVSSSVTLVGASDAHIFLCDQDADHFTFGSGVWAPGLERVLFKEVRDNGLTANVAKRGEPVIINKAKSSPLFADMVGQDTMMEAIAGFPLKRADKVVGVFNVAFLEPHTFDQDELRVLTLLADQAAIAVENARLYEETERRLKESQTLQEISRLVNSSLEPGQILQTVVEKLASAFGYDMVSIYTMEEDGLRLGAEIGYDPACVIDFIPLSKGVIGRVARSGEAELLPDVSEDPDFLAAAQGVVSEITVPIKKDDQVLGMLNVESTSVSPLTASDFCLLSSLVHQVSVAIQNAQLYQSAQRELAERERAEEALRESEERYRSLFKDSRDAVFITSRDGALVDVNESFLSLFSINREDLAHLNMDDLYAQPSARAKLEAEIEEKGSVRDYEVKLARLDGTLIDALTSSTLWRDTDGSILGYRGIIRDITERKRAQEELQRSYLTLRSTLAGTVNALAALAEARDPYTAGHQKRVANLACAIAREIGLSDTQIQGIYMAGLVHDIGKIHIPAEILSKPTELTDIERQMIRTHPQTAYEILSTVEFHWPVASVVLQHHERMDGSGYPHGLAKGEILLEARILAVADVVEAMASDRPYRPAHGIEEALAEIEEQAGTLYDQQAVETCLRLFKEKGFDLQTDLGPPP
jgi:PAS domain S-box-containing protein/putative nucleotidyltransferase with HDIG domain